MMGIVGFGVDHDSWRYPIFPAPPTLVKVQDDEFPLNAAVNRVTNHLLTVRILGRVNVGHKT